MITGNNFRMDVLVWLRRSHAPVARVHMYMFLSSDIWLLLVGVIRPYLILDDIYQKLDAHQMLLQSMMATKPKAWLLLSDLTAMWRDLVFSQQVFQKRIHAAAAASKASRVDRALPSWVCGDSAQWRGLECPLPSGWDSNARGRGQCSKGHCQDEAGLC